MMLEGHLPNMAGDARLAVPRRVDDAASRSLARIRCRVAEPEAGRKTAAQPPCNCRVTAVHSGAGLDARRALLRGLEPRANLSLLLLPSDCAGLPIPLPLGNRPLHEPRA